MIIEDDPDVSCVLEDLLQSHGFEVCLFTSGKKALEEMGKMVPDVVVMDLMMPELSGFDICRTLKSSSRTHNIPLIAITGYDSIENRKKIFDAGIDDYLPKPFDVKNLLNKIMNLVSG